MTELFLLALLAAPAAETPLSPPPLLSVEDDQLPPPPLIEAPGVPVTGDRERVVPQQDFVKGELSVFLGSDRLVTKNNRLGVSLGVDQVGLVYYGLVEPQLDLRLLDRQLAIGLGVPLRFEVFNLGVDNSGRPILARRAGELRKQDYDEASDYAKALKYLSYGRKEDRLYLNIGQRYASSIGHGPIVRRYAPNLDVDRTRVSAQLDAYNDYGGFELLTNDVVEWNLLAGLAFLKPLSWFMDTVTAKSLSLGFTWAADLAAPRKLTLSPSGARMLDANGRLLASRAPVVLMGIDAELKVLKTSHADIKPYLDYSQLLGGDGGLTLGALGRFNTSGEPVHAFRVVAEIKQLGARYQPSYLDTFYEVERFVARELPRQGSVARFATKYEDVTSGRLGERLGYLLEASWGVRGYAGFTLAAEGHGAGSEKNFVAHLEVPAVDSLQFFGSYYKRGFVELSEIAVVDAKTILFAGARLKLLPFFFINGRVYKTFRMNPELLRYDNTFGFTVDVELGFEIEGGPKA